MDPMFNAGTNVEEPSSSALYDYLGITPEELKKAAPAREAISQTREALNLPQRNTEIEYLSGTDIQEEAYVPEFKFEDTWKKPENLSAIKAYAEVRDPVGGKQREGESDEDYVKRWARSMRFNEWNTTLNAVPEITWLMNAEKEDVLKATKAYEIWDKIPSTFMPGGQSPLEAVPEAVAGAVSDVTTAASIVLGGALGSPVTLAAKREAARAAIKTAAAKKMADLTKEETKAAVRKGVVSAATAPKKQLTAIAGTEAVIGAGESAVQQQIDLVVSRARDKEKLNTLFKEGKISLEDYLDMSEQIDLRSVSVLEATFAGALSAVPTVLGAKYMAKDRINQVDELDKALKARKKELETSLKTGQKSIQTKSEEELEKIFAENVEASLNAIDLWEGRQVLNELSASSLLTEPQVQKTISRRAMDVAKYVILADPAFDEIKQRVANKSMKVMDAVGEVFKRMELEETFLKEGKTDLAEGIRINDVVLESAIKRAGLTPDEFAKITKTTLSDAGTVMQAASTISRIIQKAYAYDKDMAKVIKDMNAINDRTSGMYSFFDTLKRMETNSKALVVTSIATTVRNVAGTAGGLTMQSAADLMDGVLFAAAGGVEYLKKGQVGKALSETPIEMGKAFKDSFLTWNYLVNRGYGKGFTAATVDKILEDNPTFKNKFLGALQETGNEELWWVSRTANTFNVLQDSMFRRAIFASSVEKQLKNAGINMYDAMAQNKKVPPEIIQKAVDDALKATFSYVPKQQRKSIKTVEARMESSVANILKSIEEVPIPGFTIAVTPFPRFIANAIAFQYRYSPFGSASGMMDIQEGLRRINKGEAGGETLIQEGREKFSRGLAGTTLFLAAYDYRSQNQDTKPTEIVNNDGSKVDIAAIFPLSSYFILADTAHKVKNNMADKVKWEDVTSAITALEQRAGTQNTFLTAVKNGMGGDYSKEKEKFAKDLGNVFADTVGRYGQPLQPAFAYLELFEEESQKARDPNVITERGFIGIAVEAAENRLANKFPELVGKLGLKVKTDLPENIPYFRTETPTRPGEFFNLMKGVRELPAERNLEKAFSSLEIDPYDVYGSSGNKVYDRKVRMNAQPLFKSILIPVINSEKYKNLSDRDKEPVLREYTRIVLENAAKITKAEMMAKDIQTINRMKFNKLPSYKRKAINEKFKAENGITMDESDYSRVDEYEARLKESM